MQVLLQYALICFNLHMQGKQIIQINLFFLCNIFLKKNFNEPIPEKTNIHISQFLLQRILN